VAESLNVIKEYRLLREDIDSLIELCSWPKKKNPMDAVESKVKAALTRAYNKEVQPYSYSVVTVGAKKKRSAEVAEDEDGYGMEGEDGEAVINSDDEKEDEDKGAPAKLRLVEVEKAEVKNKRDILRNCIMILVRSTF
jgi:replication factor C subunit 1